MTTNCVFPNEKIFLMNVKILYKVSRGWFFIISVECKDKWYTVYEKIREKDKIE